MIKVYLASSWRNQHQPVVLAALRAAGFEVYDFRHPTAGDNGFSWKQIDPNYSKEAIPERYADAYSAEWLRGMLAHPIAQAGFTHDLNAMRWADACVLLLPSGMSAHLEAGWFAGAGKRVAVLAPEIREPELMYKCFDVAGATPLFDSVEEVTAHLRGAR